MWTDVELQVEVKISDRSPCPAFSLSTFSLHLPSPTLIHALFTRSILQRLLFGRTSHELTTKRD